MAEGRTQVMSLEFNPEGVVVNYTRIPRDIRKNGLAWQHAVLVPAGSDYDDEITDLLEAVAALIEDVLDDEDRAEPVELVDEEEEADE
jgi:hypothetical protein